MIENMRTCHDSFYTQLICRTIMTWEYVMVMFIDPMSDKLLLVCNYANSRFYDGYI